MSRNLWADKELSHEDLVAHAVSFLKGTMKCKPVFAEKAPWNTDERPDAFGVDSCGSVVVECKASIADYRADNRKPFRIDPRLGMGRLRYYLINESILPKVQESLRPGWGLLSIYRHTCRVVIESATFNQNSNAECLLMRSAWFAGTDGIPKQQAAKAAREFLRQMELVAN